MTAQPSLLPVALDAGEQRLVRCRICRRPLWSAEARALGVGDECRTQQFAPRSHDVEQDALPGLDVTPRP